MMATEIERKFLVRDDSWRGLGKGSHYRQGYLSTEAGRTVSWAAYWDIPKSP